MWNRFAWWQTDMATEAIAHYGQTLQIKPDLAEAHNKLAQLRAVP